MRDVRLLRRRRRPADRPVPARRAPHDHDHDHPHGHGHGHPHGHGDAHPEPDTRTVALEVDLLAKNDDLAARNRQWLADRDVVTLNLMSSPGSGKTTLLERTIRDLGGELPCAVLEGDQETLLDAERIGATGARVVQINTGARLPPRRRHGRRGAQYPRARTRAPCSSSRTSATSSVPRCSTSARPAGS